MIIVIIPVMVLLLVILGKKIPYIGGNIVAGLILTAFISLLMGGIFNPVDWIKAVIDGVDRIAWVLALSFFGSLYSEAQVKLGTVGTIMSALKARFKDSPKAMVMCIVLVLVLAGSLLGDGIAASTVVGVLTIGTLASIGLTGDMICAIIVMGASMGSIMPPMTQALALASALVDTNPDPVFQMGYFSVGIVVLVTCIYIYLFMLRDVKKIEGSTEKKASEILKENWFTLIPLFGLITVVFFRTINGPLKFDLMVRLLSAIPGPGNANGEGGFYGLLTTIPILKGISNGIVLCIIFALIISFLFPKVHKNSGAVLINGLKNVKMTLFIQLSAGAMLGGFYAGGQIVAVQEFAQGLDVNVLIWGGAFALVLIGMLTGSQSTAQNSIFSFFGPALVSIGLDPTKVALAGGHLAAAGQGAPPADLTTFVVAGIVGGALGEKVDPLRSMFYSLPMCIMLFIVGIVTLYI